MENEIGFQVRELLKIIIRGKWILIAVTMLGALGMAAYNYHSTKITYSASTTLIMIKVEDGKISDVKYSDVMAYENIMQTYNSLAKTSNVIEKVSNKLDKKMSPAEVYGSFEVITDEKTPMLTIATHGNNSEQVFKLTNAIADSLIEESKDLFPTLTMRTVSKTKEPKAIKSRNRRNDIAMGFFGGLVLSLFIITLRDFLDTTIRTEEDIEQYLGGPVIGVIPKYK